MLNRPIAALALMLSLLLAGGSSAEVANRRPLGAVLSEMGIAMEAVADFAVDQDLVSEGPERVFRNITAHKDRRRIKVEVITNAGAEFGQDYIADRQSMILSLYRPLPSPYPGMITTTIECPNEFAPTVISVPTQDGPREVHLLYATSRSTFGACVPDLIEYRAAILFAYQARAKTLVRLDFFVPKGAATDAEIGGWLGTFAFAGSGAVQQGAPESARWDDCEGCNVVIIAFDPLGANHVGAYGYPRPTTPNLDALARQAVLFENAISPSSWTLPVFMSWFTSLYPSEHGVINTYSGSADGSPVFSNLAALSPDAVTLAQVLQNSGYATAAFTGGAGVAAHFGYDLGFDTYYDETDFAGFDLLVPMALDWLDRHANQKFLLFLHGYDVHGRYRPPASNRPRFANAQYRGPYRGTAEEYWELRNQSLAQVPLTMSEADVSFWRDWYDERIHSADERVGRLLRRIEDSNLGQKTIVLVSSASGNEFYEHGRFDHGFSLYDELIRVPLILKVPRLGGRRVGQQVRTLDIMPTLLDLLHLKGDGSLGAQMEGSSLVEAVQGTPMGLDAFSETDYLNRVFKRSIRTAGGWKFIYSMDTGEKELYNLSEDPAESKNLVQREGRIAYELEQKLFGWMSALRSHPARRRATEEHPPGEPPPADARAPQ